MTVVREAERSTDAWAATATKNPTNQTKFETNPNIRLSEFELVSSFEFRISGFVTAFPSNAAVPIPIRNTREQSQTSRAYARPEPTTTPSWARASAATREQILQACS